MVYKTIADAAAELHVSIDSLRRYIRDGYFPRPPRVFFGKVGIQVFADDYIHKVESILSKTRYHQAGESESEPDDFGRDSSMANVYVEARPKSRAEGSPVDDYVVEDHADHVLATFKTQREAIEWAKGKGHAPLVARVRHLNDKKKPDHWRSA